MIRTRLDMARQLLAQARALREKVREDLRTRGWRSDDIQMEQYNTMIGTVAGLFPEDEALTHMIQMPDGILESYRSPLGALIGGNMPLDMPSSRLEARLSIFIDRLEMITGARVDEEELGRPAGDVLKEDRDNEDQKIVDEVESLREKQGLSAADVRDFDFVEDPNLREVLKQDYIEAQRAFAGGAFKACAVLAGGLIEGMLLDTMLRSAVATGPEYEAAIREFPRTGGDVNWDRVGLKQLIDAAVELKLLMSGTCNMAQGARDFRDTSHPKAELRTGSRARLEEAELLLALVKLIYRDLGAA